MNALDAKKTLEKSAVDPRIYSVGPPSLAECFVLEKQGSVWVTYDWERGCQSFKKFFATEDEAARSFIEEVAKIASISAGKDIPIHY